MVLRTHWLHWGVNMGFVAGISLLWECFCTNLSIFLVGTTRSGNFKIQQNIWNGKMFQQEVPLVDRWPPIIISYSIKLLNLGQRENDFTQGISSWSFGEHILLLVKANKREGKPGSAKCCRLSLDLKPLVRQVRYSGVADRFWFRLYVLLRCYLGVTKSLSFTVNAA